MKIDFDELALRFVRECKFSMPLQTVKAAMEIGAAEATREITELLKKERTEMNSFRERNNAPR